MKRHSILTVTACLVRITACGSADTSEASEASGVDPIGVDRPRADSDF